MYRRNDIPSLVRLLAAPAALMLLGLLLLFNPDSASAFLSRLVGWVLTAAGFVLAPAALLGDRSRWVRRAFTAGVLIVVGIWLRANPLAIAAWAGRLVGIILLLQGLPDTIDSLGRGAPDIKAAMTTILGAVLLLLPMTTSRLLISLAGILVLCVGIAMAADRLRRRNLEEGRPDIIDADE